VVQDDDEEEHINIDDHHKTNGHLRSQVEVKKRGGLEAYNQMVKPNSTTNNMNIAFNH
jgi:hypothetical protein